MSRGVVRELNVPNIAVTSAGPLLGVSGRRLAPTQTVVNWTGQR
jgi:hypothetical protein